MYQSQDLDGKKMLSLSLARIRCVLVYDGGDLINRQKGEELQIALYIRVCRFEEELRAVSNVACFDLMGLTYPIKLERARHVLVQPDCVSCAFAELGTQCCSEKWHSQANRSSHLGPGFLRDHIHFRMMLAHIPNRVHSSDDIAVLIRASDLELHAVVGVHMPPVPGLEKWIGEFRERHAVALRHLILDSKSSVNQTVSSHAQACESTHVSRPSIVPILAPAPMNFRKSTILN